MPTILKIYIIIIGLSTSVYAQRENCHWMLSGNIADYDTKEPLPFATIKLEPGGKTTLTDALGNYQIVDICTGIYTLMVSHLACETVAAPVKIRANTIKNLVLPHKTNLLNEVTIGEQFQKHGLTNSTQLTTLERQQYAGASLAEQLQQIPGVNMLQTGQNIIKPMLHGLHSNRLLLVNNGVRLESQNWGADHAPEIDPFAAQNISLVKGVGALQYGSDAIAGAIIIEPAALPSKFGLVGQFNTGFMANNRQFYSNINLANQLKNHPAWSWRLQSSAKKGGNVKTPQYYLWNTGNQKLNASAAVTYRKPGYQITLDATAFSANLGLFLGSHIGNLSDLRAAIEQPTPLFNKDAFSYAFDRPMQQVTHFTQKLKLTRFLQNQKQWHSAINLQQNRRKEFDLAQITPNAELDLNLNSIQAETWLVQQISNFQITYGGQTSYNTHVWDGNRFFIPNYEQLHAAAYALVQYQKNKWHLGTGIRYDTRWLNTYRNALGIQTTDSKHWHNLSGQLEAKYVPSEPISITFQAGYAWRPPAINELYVNGLHHGLSSYEIGDPNLTTERSLKKAIAIQYQTKKITSELFIYNQLISGFINLIPDTPATLTIRGAFPTFRFEQTNAHLYGFNWTFNYKINPQLAFKNTFSALWAFNTTNQTWLQQMPGNRMQQQLKYAFKNSEKKLQCALSLSHLVVWQQQRLSNNMIDYLPPPPTYNLWQFEAHFSLKKSNLVLGASNLLNTVYREYLNRFRYFTDEMGRNIYVKFEHKI